MSVGFDAGSERFQRLLASPVSHPTDRNEATTRLQLIDTLFFECLGWSKESDVTVEEPHGGEYADYVFSAPRRVLVVEAKREGIYFEVPLGHTSLEYSINNLIRGNAALRNALHQVSNYCQSRGIPLGIVTNGHQLVAFLASRADGQPPLTGRAVVFPSLEFMHENFVEVWNLLSKPAVEERKLIERLAGSQPPAVPPKLANRVLHYPGSKNRNSFQTDLQILSELVLEDVTRSRELEEDFLRDCYCSSGALSQYSLLSRQILQARYAALFSSSGPTAVPAMDKKGISEELLAESLSRRPILLIGDVGTGKTMFLRNLIKVEAQELFEDAIALYINLGEEATLAFDLRQYILDAITEQLDENYDVDIYERNFVRGVYNVELSKFGKGIYQDLKDSDPKAFLEKEL